jgi:Zn ribbon nucleic-acid-binding protein
MLFYIVVGVLMFISFTLLVNGLSRWNERDIVAVAYVAMGMGGLAFSIMNISSFQNKIRRMTTLTNRVVSISKCPKCGFELKRNFKEGDYVYGVGEACPNCKEHEPMTITSMFLEKPPTQKVMSRQ